MQFVVAREILECCQVQRNYSNNDDLRGMQLLKPRFDVIVADVNIQSRTVRETYI